MAGRRGVRIGAKAVNIDRLGHGLAGGEIDVVIIVGRIPRHPDLQRAALQPGGCVASCRYMHVVRRRKRRIIVFIPQFWGDSNREVGRF